MGGGLCQEGNPINQYDPLQTQQPKEAAKSCQQFCGWTQSCDAWKVANANQSLYQRGIDPLTLYQISISTKVQTANAMRSRKLSSFVMNQLFMSYSHTRTFNLIASHPSSNIMQHWPWNRCTWPSQSVAKFHHGYEDVTTKKKTHLDSVHGL